MRKADVTRHAQMTPLGRVNLVHLFPGLHAELMAVLRGLEPAAWARPTACALWSVKDIAAHLLDSCLRRLSFGRDGTDPTPDRPINGYADLVGYLNHLNALWVAANRRLSPRILMDFLDLASPQLHAYSRPWIPMLPHCSASHGPARNARQTGLILAVNTPSAGCTSNRSARRSALQGSLHGAGFIPYWTSSCGRCPTPTAWWRQRTGPA